MFAGPYSWGNDPWQLQRERQTRNMMGEGRGWLSSRSSQKRKMTQRQKDDRRMHWVRQCHHQKKTVRKMAEVMHETAVWIQDDFSWCYSPDRIDLFLVSTAASSSSSFRGPQSTMTTSPSWTHISITRVKWATGFRKRPQTELEHKRRRLGIAMMRTISLRECAWQDNFMELEHMD